MHLKFFFSSTTKKSFSRFSSCCEIYLSLHKKCFNLKYCKCCVANSWWKFNLNSLTLDFHSSSVIQFNTKQMNALSPCSPQHQGRLSLDLSQQKRAGDFSENSSSRSSRASHGTNSLPSSARLGQSDTHALAPPNEGPQTRCPSLPADPFKAVTLSPFFLRFLQ